jgi:hypothetical protein
VLFNRDDITFDGRYFKFKEGVYLNLLKVFSDKDVAKELRNAERWLLANPPKKNYAKFIVNWLNRAEQKRGVAVDEKPQSWGVRTATDTKDLGSSVASIMQNIEKQRIQ